MATNNNEIQMLYCFAACSYAPSYGSVRHLRPPTEPDPIQAKDTRVVHVPIVAPPHLHTPYLNLYGSAESDKNELMREL